jgi:hypothetical protein
MKSFSFKVDTWPTQWELDMVERDTLVYMFVPMHNPIAKTYAQATWLCLIPCFDLRRAT